MQIETLNIFCDLVDSGSFSKAAELNSITQSAVSQQIRALETRLAVKLLERGRHSVSLTAEGAVFLESSREIVRLYAAMQDRLREIQNVVGGELTIATIYSIGLHELPAHLKEFRERFPDVELHVEYRRSGQVYAEVLNGDVDMGLVSFPMARKGFDVVPFRRDRLVVICHPGHPLAQRESVALGELGGEKFIAFEPDLPTRKVVDRHLRLNRVEIEPVKEFDNVETVKRAVEIESGISIVPETNVRTEVERGMLVSVRIEPELWRPLGILLKRGRPRSPAQRHFMALLERMGAAPDADA